MLTANGRMVNIGAQQDAMAEAYRQLARTASQTAAEPKNTSVVVPTPQTPPATVSDDLRAYVVEGRRYAVTRVADGYRVAEGVAVFDASAPQMLIGDTGWRIGDREHTSHALLSREYVVTEIDAVPTPLNADTHAFTDEVLPGDAGGMAHPDWLVEDIYHCQAAQKPPVPPFWHDEPGELERLRRVFATWDFGSFA